MSEMGGADTNGAGTGGGRGWLAVVAIGLVAGGVGAFFLLRGNEAAPPPMETAAAPHEVVERTPMPEPQLPARGESDRTVRELLSKISSKGAWSKYLELDDLLNRWVSLADALALGDVPRSQLEFLAPRGQYRAVERNGREVPDPRSYARYDAFAELVDSVDVQAFASAYSKLRGLLDPAYRAFGYPNGSIDPVMARSLSRILATPVLETPPELVSKGALYEYADPKLEALSPAEKQLLRMGPRNLKVIQAKAREISAALQLSASR